MKKMDPFSLAIFAALVLLAAAAFRVWAAAQEPEPRHAEPPPRGEGPHGEPAHHGEHPQHGEHPHRGEHGVHHDFSDADRWAAVFEGDDRDEWQQPREVVRRMAVEPGMTVADLGAGSGYFLPYLSEAVGAGGRVLALDPEPNLVDFMNRRVAEHGWSNVEVRRIALDDPGMAAGSADRILVVNTWHHIDHRGAYAGRLARTLAEGGAVWVVDFTRDSPHGPPADSRLPPEQVIRELEAGGLEAEQLEAFLPWQYVIVARRP